MCVHMLVSPFLSGDSCHLSAVMTVRLNAALVCVCYTCLGALAIWFLFCSHNRVLILYCVSFRFVSSSGVPSMYTQCSF